MFRTRSVPDDGWELPVLCGIRGHRVLKSVSYGCMGPCVRRCGSWPLCRWSRVPGRLRLLLRVCDGGLQYELCRRAGTSLFVAWDVLHSEWGVHLLR